MGIFCQINLFKPSNGVFIPGSNVSGIIKYALDEETVFDNIIVSLKGIGRLVLTRRHKSKNSSRQKLFHNEDYIDIDHVIQNVERTLPVGSYETGFDFILPHNIPASLKYLNFNQRFHIRCNITYYVRIKFEKPSFFSFTKHFRKEITVISGITPRLCNEPVICGERKELTQWFSRRKSIVDIKATIQKCVYKPGEKILFDYQVVNDTNLKLKTIETKLVEIYTFYTKSGRDTNKVEDIEGTDTKTSSLQSGETWNLSVEMQIPSDRVSLENSKIVSRDYAVQIVAVTPWCHRNAVLNIPVQIGNINEEVTTNTDEPPPSYWEAMGDDRDDDDEKK